MQWLTRKIENERRKIQREKHKQANEDIKIYDRGGKRSFKVNAFAGDTTNLPFRIGQREFIGTDMFLTEQDLDEFLLIRGKRFHVRKSEVQLTPELVSDEVKDFYRAKIFAGAVRSAKNKRDKC